MPLRQIDLYLPDDCEAASFVQKERGVIDLRTFQVDGDQKILRVFAKVQESEALLDRISDEYAAEEDFRMVVCEVAATVPHPSHIDDSQTSDPLLNKGTRVTHVSREELYQAATDAVELTTVYLLMSALSAIVAAGGLLAERVTLIIGAMMIAPVFKPNMALSLATTLGDWSLGRRALIVNGVGLLTILIAAIVIGFMTPVDLGLSSIVVRREVGLADLGLALAAGAAGALSFAAGVAGALIGVVVAVALVPPLVVSGLLVGNGAFAEAAQPFLLVLTNLTSINLAGVATFLSKGIHPRPWQREQRARRVAWRVLITWIVLILVLGILAYIS